MLEWVEALQVIYQDFINCIHLVASNDEPATVSPTTSQFVFSLPECFLAPSIEHNCRATTEHSCPSTHFRRWTNVLGFRVQITTLMLPLPLPLNALPPKLFNDTDFTIPGRGAFPQLRGFLFTLFLFFCSLSFSLSFSSSSLSLSPFPILSPPLSMYFLYSAQFPVRHT